MQANPPRADAACGFERHQGGLGSSWLRMMSMAAMIWTEW